LPHKIIISTLEKKNLIALIGNLVDSTSMSVSKMDESEFLLQD